MKFPVLALLLVKHDKQFHKKGFGIYYVEALLLYFISENGRVGEGFVV